jgi:hypothetical protein
VSAQHCAFSLGEAADDSDGDELRLSLGAVGGVSASCGAGAAAMAGEAIAAALAGGAGAAALAGELELELILSRWLWERGEKGGASLQKQARVRALCGVMQ